MEGGDMVKNYAGPIYGIEDLLFDEDDGRPSER